LWRIGGRGKIKRKKDLDSVGVRDSSAGLEVSLKNLQWTNGQKHVIAILNAARSKILKEKSAPERVL
jgi:hypothetical protein